MAETPAETVSLESILDEHIPADKLAEVKRILYGRPCEYVTTHEPLL